MPEEEEYLSDGVYASWDGFYVRLRADNNYIFLDDVGLDGLFQYIKRIGFTIKCKEKDNESKST